MLSSDWHAGNQKGSPMKHGPAGRPIELLLIEDDPDDAFLIQEMLSDAGGAFHWAHSERLSTALERLARPGRDGIEAILLDVATLAIRLDKPLSARLLPVPGKTAGEMTDFGSPYLIDIDYFGKKRMTTNPYPGPFELPEGGRQVLRVWPTKRP